MALQRFTACSDTHGCLINAEATEVFLRFVDDFKPDYRFHLGDVFDFAAFRKGIKDNSDPDSQEDIIIDKEETYQFLYAYRPDILTLGNHDARLWRIASEYNAINRALAKTLIEEIDGVMNDIGCSYLPYHYKKGIFKIGNGTWLHGFHCNINSTQQHAAEYGGYVFFGHTHRAEIKKAKRNDNSVGYNIGCMCNYEQMQYCSMRTATLAWRRAFAYGTINDKTGDITAWLAEEGDDGSWILPSEMKIYGGK